MPSELATLRANQFQTAALQFAQFTPDHDVSTGKVVAYLLGSWGTLFDGPPLALPIPGSVPREVPRVILQSAGAEYRCEVSPEKVSVFWRRSGTDATVPSDFIQSATSLLGAYATEFAARVGRLAFVHTRFALHDAPGLFLARHFCQTRWDTAPLNRPENFELHAHKFYRLNGRFPINSWVRNKSARTPEGPAVLVEQDLNTSVDDLPTVAYSDVDAREYFVMASSEAEDILTLYYPLEES